jgi:sugar phosphate isomerase/epimerase
MLPGISTHVFYPHRLHAGLLEALRSGGAQAIELFAARHHFDYTDRTQVREIANWFRVNDVLATMHAPLATDETFSRHTGPTLNLVDRDKGRRIAAMDEIKRALETAEQIAIATCVLHLGLGGREDRWSEHVLEYSLTAVEHLNAFAAPLGVKLLLENLRSEVATPENLVHILKAGHFDRCGICLDVGHAHLSDEGIAKAFEILGPRVKELHLHDNHGPDAQGDEHLWPATEGTRPAGLASGTIDWNEAYKLASTLPPTTVGMLEIADPQAASAETATRIAQQVFGYQARLLAAAS